MTDQKESAINFIRNHAEKYANAKGDRIYLENFRKSKLAILINIAEGLGRKTIQERECYARSHAEYLQVLEGLKVAVQVEEKLLWEMRAAQASIDIWRTKQANARREFTNYEN